MTQSALERALFPHDPHLGKGRMSRYMTGTRGGSTIDVFLFERIADILHVNFHWLVTGRGLMTAPDEQQKTE